MFLRDTSGCSSLSRQKNLENNIRMYLSLLLILSVSYSRMTEINERQTCADYFCIFLGRSLQKSWSQVQLPWSAGGLPDKQNGEIDFCTQIRSPRLCFVLFLKKDILNLTSDAQPSSVHPHMLM